MKKLYLVTIAFFTNIVFMFAQNTGYHLPSVYSSSGNGASWANLSGVMAVDNNPAYADLAQYPVCNTVICYYSNIAKFSGFGFNVPANATITGIELQILQRVSSPGGGIHDSTLFLTVNGSVHGLNKADTANWSDTPAYRTYGSMTDDWGYPWTAAEINDTSFGFMYQITDTSYDQPGSVDHLQMIVYYQTGTGIISEEEQSIQIYFSNKSLFINDPVQTNNESYSLEIENNLGKVVYKEIISSVNNNLSIENELPSFECGIYYFRLASKSRVLCRKLFYSK